MDAILNVSSRLAKLPKSSASLPPNSASGRAKAPSARSKLRAVTISSTLQVSKDSVWNKLNLTVQSSSTLECPRQNNETISKDNKNTSNPIYLTNIPDKKLTSSKSTTSAPESTSRGLDFYEYWDSSRVEEYRNLLWLPRTASQDLVSSSLNGFAGNSNVRSSFSIIKTEPLRRNSERTSWPSYKYIVVDGMEGGATKIAKKPPLRALKLKLNPSAQQKSQLERMAGCSRFTFNKAVAMRMDDGSTQRDLFRIRDRIVTLKPRGEGRVSNSFFNNKKWLLDCPKSIRMNAVKDAVSNVKACFSNLREGNIDKFKSPFRSKKMELLNGWSLRMDQKNVMRKNDGLFVFKDILGEMRYHNKKQLDKLLNTTHPEHDPMIQKNKYGEYFLILIKSVERREKKAVRAKITVDPLTEHVTLKLTSGHHERFASCSIDPGVRKTLTTYSPENMESLMIGKGQSSQLMKMLIAYEKQQSELTKSTSWNTTRRLKESMKRIRKRMFNLKKEFRDQTASFLAQRYNILLVPKLDTKNMSSRANRRLKTKVVKGMLNLGHSMIFNKLKEKCQEYGTVFMEVKEHYTSQTCLCCGHLKKCNEVYSCSNCDFSCDRDILGAAGIFLKSTRNANPRPVKKLEMGS